MNANNQSSFEETASPSVIYNIARQIDQDAYRPCVAFQLNSFRCMEIFNFLLLELERREKIHYPNLVQERIEKQEEIDNAREKAKAEREELQTRLEKISTNPPKDPKLIQQWKVETDIRRKDI